MLPIRLRTLLAALAGVATLWLLFASAATERPVGAGEGGREDAGFWARRVEAVTSWLAPRFDAHAVEWALFPPTRVTGVVVEGWRKTPLEGAEVALRASFDTDDGAGRRDAFVEVARMRTDASGRFDFARPRGAQKLEVALVGRFRTSAGLMYAFVSVGCFPGGSGPGGRTPRERAARPIRTGHSLQGVSFACGSRDDPGREDVVLPAFGAGVLRLRYALDGVATAEEASSLVGRTVAIVADARGASVVRTATVGEDGVAEFEGVPLGPWAHHVARLPTSPRSNDFLVVPRGFRVRPIRGETVEVDVPVVRESRRVVRLVDEAGEPLAGAALDLESFELASPFDVNAFWRVESGRDGRAPVDVLSGVLSSVRVSVDGGSLRRLDEGIFVEVQKRLDHGTVLAIQRGGGPVEIRVEPPPEPPPRYELSGRVMGGDPAVDGGLEVAVERVGPAMGPNTVLDTSRAVRASDDDARFESERPPGRYLVAARLANVRFGLDSSKARARWPWRTAAVEVDLTRGPASIELERVAPSSSRLQGVVRHADGSAAGGIGLRIAPRGEGAFPCEPIPLRTNEQGRFTLLDVPKGRYEVRTDAQFWVSRDFDADGVAPVVADVDSEGATEVTLTLPARRVEPPVGAALHVRGRVGVARGTLGTVHVVAHDRHGVVSRAEVGQEGVFDLTCRTDSLERVTVEVRPEVVSHPMERPQVVFERRLGPSRTRDVDLGAIELPAGSIHARLSHELADTGGHELELGLRALTGPGLERVGTRAGRWSHVPFLPGGRYEVFAVLPGGARCERVEPVVVELGDCEHLLVVLDTIVPE